MKSEIKFLGILGFLLISVFNTKAQTDLTLQEAITYALNNSEAIKKAQLDIQNGLSVVKETRGSAMPQINAVSNITLNPIVQQFVLPAEFFGGEPGTFSTVKAGQTWNAMTNLQVQQQVYNQTIFTGLKAAKSSAEFYNLLKEVSEENVVEQVATAYYQVLTNQQKLGLLEDNIERTHKLKAILTGLLDNGMGKKIDVDRVEVNRINFETQKLQLENAILLQKNMLKYYMSMPMEQEITLPMERMAEIEQAIKILSLDSNLDMESIIGIKVLRKQDELYGLNMDAAKAAFYPTAAITGQYTLNSQSDKFNLYMGKALNFDVANIQLGINVPIFDGRARRERVEQAKIQILKNQEEISATQRALNMAFENAKIQIRNSLEAIRNQQINLKLAEDVYNDTNANFNLGLVGLTDLLNAESELTRTQNGYSEALLQFKVAELEFLKSKGQIKTLAY